MSTNKTNNKEQYEIILKLYNGLSGNLKLINQKVSKNKEDNSKTENQVRDEVLKLCSNFPIYNHLMKE